ncbi:MAG: two component transcriptional regulator, LuxR family [Planctomycetaceae bacterium]|nr:two component transcriptional regulator, LuxR family [Planctomycetaceae bacterium]
MDSPIAPIDASVNKILLVDDHPAIREALALRIAEHSDLAVSREAHSIATALEALRTQRPDVVIVDITLKDGNGIELIKSIQAHDDSIRILVCSMHDEAIYAERAIRAGAMGYITKEHATTEIIQAIRRIIDNKLYISDQLAEALMHRSLGKGQPRANAESVHLLSDRELEVFEFMGQGVETAQIAERMHVSPKTVDTYRARIKDKLGVQTMAELIRRAVEWKIEKK